jgi:hypothetical protein
MKSVQDRLTASNLAVASKVSKTARVFRPSAAMSS